MPIDNESKSGQPLIADETGTFRYPFHLPPDGLPFQLRRWYSFSNTSYFSMSCDGVSTCFYLVSTLFRT